MGKFEVDGASIETTRPDFIGEAEYTYPMQKSKIVDSLKSALRECLALQAENDRLKDLLADMQLTQSTEEICLNRIKADAVREAKECSVLSHPPWTDDFEAGFEHAIDQYEKYLDDYANKLEGKE